ncbi:hypothetical protein [Sediminibacterium sp.]|uniref:hypothetical protein n=1 Tax=Sediminibacterium sp. TaxID=1917865 RepID=UPI0025D8C3B8|nr:hypothetical protein [Sediminibacterium sp.]MBW0178067.1 hypothetical protein [Sediminibacterium sp.]
MIAKEQNQALLTVGNAALKNPAWVDYANYCFDREKGLRKQAFHQLDNFLKSTDSWTEERKKEFVQFLFPFMETVQDADYGPFPQLLSEQLVKPVLEKWCETEKTDARPFRWFGTYYRSEEYLFKALDIDPADDIARKIILKNWTDSINYSLHHLPEYYIGDPIEDIQLAEKIKIQIDQLATASQREHWVNILEADMELVRNYIEWQTSGHKNFAEWGLENKKKTGYDTIQTYYYEK